MITYQVEALANCLSDALPHFPGHYRDACQHQGALNLHPDYARYYLLEERGQFFVVTARHKGVLIGYASFFVDHQIHYAKTRWAESDIYWVHPDFRGHGVWSAMRASAEVEALSRGVTVFRVRLPRFLASKGGELEAEGFAAGDTVYEKVLG